MVLVAAGHYPLPSQLSKKAQISFAQYEKETLLNTWHFFNTGQENDKERIHSLRKKITELKVQRFQKTCGEMEARLCVTRLFVYCIYTGHCGLG